MPQAELTGSTHDTVELVTPATFAESFFATGVLDLEIEFGGATDRGKVRPNNEDQFAIFRRRRATEIVCSSFGAVPVPEDVSYGLVVADGVGGSHAGEVASRLAIQSMLELSGQATSWVMKLQDPAAQQIQERAEAYIQRVQETLLSFSQALPSLAGMGTTWTSAQLLPPHAIVVHLGDSRAYLFHSGRLQQITRDETMAQAFIDSGADPNAVRRFRKVLLNSLGGNQKSAVAQIHCIDFGPGDRLLLCTDGLYEMVAAEEIERALQRHAPPQEICETLVRQALDAGGKDNVTVVLAVAKPPARPT
jgi:protein phosphatase